MAKKYRENIHSEQPRPTIATKSCFCHTPKKTVVFEFDAQETLVHTKHRHTIIFSRADVCRYTSIYYLSVIQPHFLSNRRSARKKRENRSIMQECFKCISANSTLLPYV